MKNITSLIIGFLGGLISSIGILYYTTFGNGNLKNMEHLLGWPFLGFILFVSFFALFYNNIKDILSKGNIKIKLGDQEITIQQVIENAESEYEDRFVEIEEKIRDLETQIHQNNTAGNQIKNVESNETTGGLTIEIIKSKLNIEDSKLSTLIHNLFYSLFKWRKEQTLVRKSGLRTEEIQSYSQEKPDIIIRSLSKNGNTIYRLSDYARLKLKED